MIAYRINGESVSKEEWDSRQGVGLKPGHAPMGTVAYSESNPLPSDGAGCMKSQVPELRAEIRKRNIRGVRVCDNGRLEITSRRGRKELLKVRGLVDNDGGYGD